MIALISVTIWCLLYILAVHTIGRAPVGVVRIVVVVGPRRVHVVHIVRVRGVSGPHPPVAGFTTINPSTGIT